MDTIFVDMRLPASGTQVREYQAVGSLGSLVALKAEPGQFVYVRSNQTVYSLQCNLWCPVLKLDTYFLPTLTRPQELLLHDIRDAGKFLLFQQIDGDLVSIDNQTVIGLRNVSIGAVIKAGYIQEVRMGDLIYLQAIPQRVGGRTEVRYKPGPHGKGASCILADHEIKDGSTRAERLQDRVVE
jgi:hypothetical protein